MSSKRVLSLEAFRGIAAAVVLFYHALLAFWPAGIGVLPGTPAYLLFNGNAAVGFFFVLSGVVNGRPLFRDPSGYSLIRGLVRRWPRLMFPSLLASLFAWALYALGLYHHEAAGDLSGSKWLHDFANAAHPADFHPSLIQAVWQGAVSVFVDQHSDYDPPLWTMHFELLGSSLVLLLAFVLARLSLLRGYVALAVAVVGVALIPPHYGIPFVVGLGLTFGLLRLNERPIVLSDRMWLLLFLGFLYVFAYDKPVGMHAWVPEPDTWFGMEVQRILLQSLGAAGIMFVGLKWPRLGQALSTPLSERMGEMAFPVFLLHVPVYCSLASWVLVTAEPLLGYTPAALLAAASGMAGTLPIAWAFARIDHAWAPLVNRWVDQLLAKVRHV